MEIENELCWLNIASLQHCLSAKEILLTQTMLHRAQTLVCCLLLQQTVMLSSYPAVSVPMAWCSVATPVLTE